MQSVGRFLLCSDSGGGNFLKSLSSVHQPA
jgi:hypothetical protein